MNQSLDQRSATHEGTPSGRTRAVVPGPPIGGRLQRPRVWRLGVLVLVVGVGAFGTIYYQDQHVSAGPSLIDRQTTNAEAAVKQAPNNIDARLTLAADYQLDKRSSDALNQYNIILKAVKGNRFALLGQGSVLIAQGK